ncbi:MAG: TrkH family potassium uptake protein [Liquorilactobacillus ghanensis]|uniref:TrkH family potassium uptake protein n=1 Tax=Liquorilactobacillus ghanensis TaxID=399370 RepID=UPI0039E79444
MHFLSKLKTKVKTEATPIQLVVSAYLILILLTFFLLNLPIFLKPGAHVGLLDSFFMSVSTISVTGLTTFPLSQVYNHAGILLLEFLFQIGGFGVTMLATVIMILSGRKISLQQRQLIQVDMNQPRLSGTVRLSYSVFILMVLLQLFFGMLFSIYFTYQNGISHLKEAIFNGFYISISAVTNAGFDITGNSLAPFRHNYIFLLTIMFLIMLGGIGFPVLVEFQQWIFYKFHHPQKMHFKFSLFSKLALLFAIIFFIVGTVLIFLTEFRGQLANESWPGKLMTAMFYSASTRNAGLQLESLKSFQTSTLLIFSLLMFIGASPSSVGGGVRTTTIGILLLYLAAFIRGRRNVNIFGRRISQSDIQKAIVVTNLSMLLCMGAVLILSITEHFSLISLIFEVAAAFGTTGLSMGITAGLSVVGKWVIIVLMFIGRVGMLYMLLLFVSKREQDFNYEYPTEQVIIG